MPSLWSFQRLEVMAWRRLTQALLDAGAITEADLNAPVVERDTPGKRALQAIREWGQALSDLTLAQQSQDDLR